MRSLLCVLLLVVCGDVHAEEYAQRAKAVVLEVIDGDTIKADIDLGYDVWLRSQVIRLGGFDAPEISRRRKTVRISGEEIAKGKLARAHLTELISRGVPLVEPSRTGKSVYGRLECRLLIATESELIDVAREMKLAGFER